MWSGLGYICLDFNNFCGNLHLTGHIPDDGDKMTDPAVQQVSYTSYPGLFVHSRPKCLAPGYPAHCTQYKYTTGGYRLLC